LPKRKRNTIGPNKVAVPSAFYKAILAPSPEPKAICFLLPHKGPHKPLQAYTITIDELEEKTGLDLFSALPDLTEDSIESSFSLDAWKWDEKDIVKKRPPKKTPSK
jgi:endonuclease G